jgi:hypothetical protein
MVLPSSSTLAEIERAADEMEGASLRYIYQVDFNLGNQAGWVLGMIDFEVVLAVVFLRHSKDQAHCQRVE